MNCPGAWKIGSVGKVLAGQKVVIDQSIVEEGAKEQYKLSNGKYVFPAVIEEEIKLIPYVANATIYGDGKPFNVCIVIPDFEVAARWADKNGASGNPRDLLANKAFTDMVENAITQHLRKDFGGYEIPKRFMLLKEDFSVENGMLTDLAALQENPNRFLKAFAKKGCD